MKHRSSTILRVLAVCAVLPFLASCGVIFGGTRQNISAMSSPPGATVTTTPATVGYTTPTSLNLERKQEYTLTFAMPGYSSQQVQLQRRMRTGILVADILLTGLIGVVVDASTGAWYQLSPDNTSVSLTKVGAGPGPASITVTMAIKDQQLHIASSEPGVTVNVR